MGCAFLPPPRRQISPHESHEFLVEAEQPVGVRVHSIFRSGDAHVLLFFRGAELDATNRSRRDPANHRHRFGDLFNQIRPTTPSPVTISFDRTFNSSQEYNKRLPTPSC